MRVGAEPPVSVVMPYSAVATAFYWCWPIAIIAFLIPVAAIALAAALGGGSSPVVPLVVAVAAVVGVCYAVVFLLDVLRGRITRGQVALAPEGIGHRSWTFRSFVGWGEVLYVAPAQADGHWVQVGVAIASAP